MRQAAGHLVMQLLDRHAEEAAEKQKEQAAAASGGGRSPAAAAAKGKGKAGAGGKKGGGGGGAGSTSADVATPNRKQLEGVLRVMDMLRAAADNAIDPFDLNAATEPASPLGVLSPGSSQGGSQGGGAAGGGGRQQPLDAESTAALVDALYGKAGCLTDWQLLADELGDDDRLEGRGALGNAHVAGLLAAAVQQAVTPSAAAAAAAGGGGKGRGGGGRRTAPAPAGGGGGDGSDPERHRQAFTTTMMRCLPGLLRKHQADAPLVAPLLSAMRHLNLELYALKQEAAGYEGLLKQVSTIFFKHTAPEVLRHCVAVLVPSASNDAPVALQQSGARVLADCCSSISSRLSAATKAVRGLRKADLEDAFADFCSAGAGGGGVGDGAAAAADSDELYTLHVALQRLYCMLSAGESPAAESAAAHDALQSLLDDVAVKGRPLPPAVTCAAVSCLSLLLTWSMHRLAAVSSVEEADAAAPGPSSSRAAAAGGSRAAEAVAKKRAAFMSQLAGLLDACDDDGARDTIYHVIMDHLLFAAPAASGGRWAGTALAALPPLAVPEPLLRKCWEHCVDILARGDAAAEAAAQRAVADSADADASRVVAIQAAMSEAVASAGRSRVAAVAAVGRLCCFNVLSASGAAAGGALSWLPVHLVAEAASHGPEVAEAVKEVCRQLRSSRAVPPPDVYLGALQLAYSSMPQVQAQLEAQRNRRGNGGGGGSASQAAVPEDEAERALQVCAACARGCCLPAWQCSTGRVALLACAPRGLFSPCCCLPSAFCCCLPRLLFTAATATTATP